MKKLILAIISMTSLFGSLALSAAPASASAWPTMGDIYYTEGDTVNLDLGCQADGITAVNFYSGSLPPGLTMDAQGLVTGVPTTVGEYTISNYSCTYNWGGNGISWAGWYLTFHVTPATTPDPILAVHNLNTENCSFYFGYLFPQNPDNGSVYISITNQAGTTYYEQASAGYYLVGGQLGEQEVAINDLNTWPNGSITGSEPFKCGDTISVTLGWRWGGAPVATKTISNVKVDKPSSGSEPTLIAYQVVGSECNVNVVWPTSAFPIGTGIILRKESDPFPGNSWLALSGSDGSAGALKATLSLSSPASQSVNVGTIGSGYAGADCSGNWVVGLYSDTGSLISETPLTLVPAPGGEQTFVRAVPLNNSNCEFKVIAALPSSADSGSIGLRFKTTGASLNEVDGWIQDAKVGQVFEATFNPTSLLDDIRNNPEDFDDWDSNLTSGISCSNLIDVTLEYYQSGVKITRTTNVIPTMPAQDSPASFSISAYPAEDRGCAISVEVKAPDVERPLTVAVVDPDSGEDIALIYYTGGTTTDGTFTATLSMVSYSDFASSIEPTDKDINQQYRCFGKFEVGIFKTGHVKVASDITYLQRPPTLCGAGYVITQDRLDCDAVPRGFYTVNYNSITATACPAGMTTESTGSKSPNDCYKPIVQTIANLKAPKALKFKASVNIPLGTNAGVNASASSTGGCKAVPVQVVTKVKGKNITSTMLKITAGSKAATCSIALSSPETGKYLAFTKSLSIKVSKTGK